MLKNKLKPVFGIKSAVLSGVCVLLCTLDLVTKYLEEKAGWNAALIPGWVEIQSGSRNPGCAFSFLDENPEIGQPVLITFTILMIIGLVAVFIFLPDRFTLLKTSVSIVVAGAIGNLIDRFMFREVRDFIGLNMLFNGSLVYCNIADFCIVIGAVLAALDLLFFNEWAVLPLTRKAREAQKAVERAEAEKKAEDGEGERAADGGEADGNDGED